ncbi:putative membrane protein [Faunimonas pinastri]|uniref:Putative membrane protein n=1 Tax=Faunimonas pinastri TaxID=1855383 RepID=A0A1H9AQG7_9HYPH|nr:DUF202 domain-containing protein [Faunimonas pinastri]SEP78771.1 putative membrane protein [Faunimonas pinastri]
MADKIEQGAQKLAKSAERMKDSTEQMEDSADRRTQLAADRTVFAAERTYAAWVRTGLASLASGVGAKSLLAGVIPNWSIIAVGTVLVLFSGFCFAAAVYRQINPGPPPPRADAHRLPGYLLLFVNAFLFLVSLGALIGIWFGRTGA